MIKENIDAHPCTSAGLVERRMAKRIGVAGREIDRGVAVCGSGAGACVAANKGLDIRAGLIHETFSAHL
jgi:ribose 5-phosphate isomerase RpiB